MAWAGYLKNAIDTGHIERVCVLYHTGKVAGELSVDGAGFHPCGYAATTAKDDGTETQVQINEEADIVNYICKGKKPPTGVRFYGTKYFPCGGTPKKEDDGIRHVILGRGTGSHLIISVTKKHIMVAQNLPGKGQNVSSMNDHIQGVTAGFLSWE
jgi:hypothetical protein